MKDFNKIDNNLILSLYQKMLLIRNFEEKIEYGFSRNEIHGTTHLCVGQEAVPVGVCASLNDNDYVVSTHRGHGHALAKGLQPEKLMSEIMGKNNGYCKGKGGTQHSSFFRKGFIGTNGITGGGIPIATGAAFSIKYKGTKNISVCFFGDGATNQGTFHESLNMASIWNLPVLYVCENNFYAMSTPISLTLSSNTIVDRAKAYNIDGITVNGMDVLEVYTVSKEAIRKVRTSPRPVFLECLTYRFKGHSKSDPRVYRSKDEEAEWKEKCPISKLREFILKEEMADKVKLKEIENNTHNEIENIYKKAMKYPFPHQHETLKDIFCD